jgi:molybdate transport system regulatory protein
MADTLWWQKRNGVGHHGVSPCHREPHQPIRKHIMSISARNIFKGKVSAIKGGPVNAEIEITTPGGDRIVAMLTECSVQSLGLALGGEAVAVVKTPWVTLLSGTPQYRFSARNQ